MLLNSKVWAVLSLPVLLFALLLVLGGGAGENGGSTSLMGGELREIDRFRRAQARLERATGAGRLGVKAMVAHNMAEGDGLEAEMMERRSAGRREGRRHGMTWQALRDADATIANVGLGSDVKGLLGHLRGRQIAREMSDTGEAPSRRAGAALGASISEELKESEQQLGGMIGGGLGRRFASRNEGLGATALDTVARGIEGGLDVRRLDPADGVQTGQLSMSDSSEADRIAQGELRGVASGRLEDGGTLVGMGK